MGHVNCMSDTSTFQTQGFNIGMSFTGNGFDTQFGPAGHSCPNAQCTDEEAYVVEQEAGPVLLGACSNSAMTDTN